MPTSIAGPSLKDAIADARRRSADTRPALLAMLVERLTQAGRLEEADVARLRVLLPRLLEAVDPLEARRIAERLAPRSDLPPQLAELLARGPLAMAEPFLRLSPLLDEAMLEALAAEADRERLAAIAARREVSTELAKRLASTVHHARESAPPPRPTPALPDFFAAAPEERAAQLHRLVTLPPLPLAERVAAAPQVLTDALLAASKSGDRVACAGLIERALGVPAEVAGRVVEDESGQSLAVAARALGLSFAVLSRMLFRLAPQVGRSPDDMARLADLFDALPLTSAQHMVALWRGPRRPAPARPTHETPSMRDFAVPRPAASRTTEASGKADASA